MPSKPTPVRITLSNVLLGDDYTGRLYVGSQRNEVNLLLDTGSSTLAIDHKSYDPRHDPRAKVTDLVQEVSYGDGSNWIGSVVQTDMTVSQSGRSIDLPDVSVAVAYHESVHMFGKSQGILGLAYEPLDDAVDVDKPTVPPHYSPNDVRAGRKVFVEPYFRQLEKAGLVANKFAFYTRRSTMHASKHPERDPLNHGYLILGGGEEATDLYTGGFKTAVVLSDDYYSVNLKQVIVGKAGAIHVRPPTKQSTASTNAIVDSGTNGLDIAPSVFDAILEKLPPDQVKLMRTREVSTSRVNLAEWPTITFVLQGERGDIRLVVKPEHYWQMDEWESGTAVRALWRADNGEEQSTLGLPLMNAYFTVFDCSLNHGLGVVKFAQAKQS